MFDKPNKPQVEEKVETPEVSEVAPVVEKSAPVDDRSAYNCQPCKGEGLVGEVGFETRCPNCGGTGKV